MKTAYDTGMEGALRARLLGRSFLQKSGMTAAMVREVTGRESWKAAMARVLLDHGIPCGPNCQLPAFVNIPRGAGMAGRFTCTEIFEIVRTAGFYEEEPEEGWLAFSYHFSCRILYPDKAAEEDDDRRRAPVILFLEVLQFFFDYEKKAVAHEPFWDFDFLRGDEIGKFEAAEEYRAFLRYFRAEYIYEMMRLNLEVTSFHTLEHIAGVHHVAMHVARGLYQAGVPVDLAMVSGAAAGHDLGKFGCKPNEKVPFLHYFYTDQWFRAHRLEAIGHIAANHSTWDLEPENLSVESLILIYSDFRVKQSRTPDHQPVTVISSLGAAFDVIRNKMYNVDAKKLRRYKGVYATLTNFEDFMRRKGVDTALNGSTIFPQEMPKLTLRDGQDTVESLVLMGVEHDIGVMRRLSMGRQFGNFLEAARSEKNWKNLRAYLSIFEQYIIYISDSQKRQALQFLYELMMHREGDIRLTASRLIGKVIAQFHFGYRKQYPQGMPDKARNEVNALWRVYLEKTLDPDLRLNSVQKIRIGNRLKSLVGALMAYADPLDIGDFIGTFLERFQDPEGTDDLDAFYLMNSFQELPLGVLTPEQLRRAGHFLAVKAVSERRETQVSAWRAAKVLVQFKPDNDAADEIRRAVESVDVSGNVTLLYLRFRIRGCLGLDVAEEEERLYGNDVVADIFLDDLKNATPWIVKEVNIKLLKNQMRHGSTKHSLHIASHLANLLKVSDHVLVRWSAGDALLEVIRMLRQDERNEVVVELMRGLEITGTNYSAYIPEYLGQVALWLPLGQLREVVHYIRSLLANADERIVAGAMDTAGVMLMHWPEYRERFLISDAEYRKGRIVFLGAILRGFASYRPSVRQEAMMVTGQLFASKRFPEEEKFALCILGAKKYLFLLNEAMSDESSLFYRACAISAISRFIKNWQIDHGPIAIPEREKVAFFPGTFDPFTLSHKEIVTEIRNRGFEVYLAVDEFSWSKKTQPHLIRRQIVSMSIADELHVNIFPDDIPVNIAMPKDLRRLRELFPGREVYMVAGSDVIAHASSYKKEPVPYSIHSMNHIAFRRVGPKDADSRYNRGMLHAIQGNVEELELPVRLEEISSTMIRENIDMNRDISNLIDPAAQEYIYNNSLYLREPEYKPLASGMVVAFEDADIRSAEVQEELCHTLFENYEQRIEMIRQMAESGDDVLILRNMLRDNKIVGAVFYRCLEPDTVFDALGNVQIADLVRHRTSGKVLLITGLFTEPDSMMGDPDQFLLAEAIARSFRAGCSYSICYPSFGPIPDTAVSALRRQGYQEATGYEDEVPVWMVDMHEPLVILKNLETTIKEPLASSPQVRRTIERAHRRLQETMTRLYPGQLVLSVSSATIYPRLVEKITHLNGVPNHAVTPRTLGPYMCVPFGKILRDKVIPNTVTKTLHTDKVYDPGINQWKIEAFPNYTPLETQIRMIHSFERPVILVDDILHEGDRFMALDPILRREHVEVKKVITGVISGHGHSIMAVRGVDVDSVYMIPNLRQFVAESTLYPFIGGDTVRRNEQKISGLSPSVNMILPYTSPHLEGADGNAVYEFSRCCIENSRDILLALEENYLTRFGRNLTLGRLAEAVIAPLCPDRGSAVNYDPNLRASMYLDNDLEQLYRIRKIAAPEG